MRTERETVRVGQYVRTGVRDGAQRAADETDSDVRKAMPPCGGRADEPRGRAHAEPTAAQTLFAGCPPGREACGPGAAGTASQSPTPHGAGLPPSASGLPVTVQGELATNAGHQNWFPSCSTLRTDHGVTAVTETPWQARQHWATLTGGRPKGHSSKARRKLGSI